MLLSTTVSNGITAVQQGNGTGQVTVAAPPARITNTLTNAAGFRVIPAPGFAGDVVLTIHVTDHGNTERVAS
jgi:hypothetical protein